MYRAMSPYAIAAMLLLALGLVVSCLARMGGVSITWRNTGHSFSYQVFFYGFAAFFCVYAFVTSIGPIPFGPALLRWHFRLSAGSVLLLLAAFTYIASYLYRHPGETRIGPMLLLAIGSVLTSLLVFSLAQLWFAIDLIAALWRMRATD